MSRRSGAKSTASQRGRGRRGDRAQRQTQAAWIARRTETEPSTDPPAIVDGSGPAPVEPETLVASAWFDSGDGKGPYSATVRFTGQRLGASGNRGKHDMFVQDETVDGIIPGSGTVSVSTWIQGLSPGEWTVTAELRHPTAGGRSVTPGASRVLNLADWSWRRWTVDSAQARPLKTRWAPLAALAGTPGVMPGVYTALAVVGGIITLVVQAAILSSEGISVWEALAASLLAIGMGLIGAKAWYAVLHPDESVIKGGWAVDGFLVVWPIVAAIALMAANLPIGRVLDATTPGLFFAVAVGRIGCFLTGCCAGKMTNARWGVWSSDRRVGARRVPTQLIESATGLLLGVVTLPLAASHVLPIHGAVFVVGLGLYAGARQALLRLRAERRAWAASLPLTAGAALAVLILVTVLAAAQVVGTPSFA